MAIDKKNFDLYADVEFTKNMFIEAGFCLPLLLDWDEFFGDENAKIKLSDAYPLWQAWLDGIEDRELAAEWEQMTDEYFSSENFRKSIGIELMATEKYHVFNSLSGGYEEVTGLEAAKARRQEIMQEFLESNMVLFNVNREYRDAAGNTVLKPVDDSLLND